MRLGSANTYDRALQNLYSRQTELSNQQEKLTSGKNVNRPSDDPTGAAQAERALTRLARISSDNRSLEVQRSAITLAESTLGDATSLVQKLRELVITAGNAGYSASDRKSVAQEMRGLRDQLFALANARDANGTPLFGALGSASAPFTDSSGGVSFNGVAGQRASTETSIPGTMDGQAVWMNVASGNGRFALSTGTSNTGSLWTNTGQVLTPASLTGHNYTITFSVVGAATTYSVQDTTNIPAYLLVQADRQFLHNRACLGNRRGTFPNLPVRQAGSRLPDGLNSPPVQRPDKLQRARAENIPILLIFIGLDRHSLCFRCHLLDSSEKQVGA